MEPVAARQVCGGVGRSTDQIPREDIPNTTIYPRTLASRFDHKDMGPVADVMEQSKSGTIRQRRIESTKSPKYRDSSTTLSNLCYTRHDGTQRPNITVGFPRGSFTISNACHKKLAINAYSHLLRERETSEVQGTPRSSIHPIIF
jgi:hypothetical protein